MKTIKRFALFAALLFAAPLLAQTTAPTAPAASPSNIYAAGTSWNQSTSPQVAGTALYARLVNDGSGTYAFSVVDALPVVSTPGNATIANGAAKVYSVDTDISVGIAQQILTIHNVPIFVPTSAGVSFNGSNTGWAWTTGAMAAFTIKGNWKVFPVIRVAKSSVGGEGYQPIIGIMFGWGQ